MNTPSRQAATTPPAKTLRSLRKQLADTQGVPPYIVFGDATLVQMARDIYPHDRLGDKFYAVVAKGHDTADAAPGIEEGIASLNALAVGAGAPSYAETSWEADRVALLRQIESTPFFQGVRGGMMVSLYNNPEVCSSAVVQLPQDQFGELVYSMAAKWNNALVVGENNDIHFVLDCLWSDPRVGIGKFH